MDAQSREHVAVEQRKEKHGLFWRRLWPFLFTVALVIALIFGYAWWSLSIIFDQMVASVVAGSIDTRTLLMIERHSGQ